jgi:hypothetical protein
MEEPMTFKQTIEACELLFAFPKAILASDDGLGDSELVPESWAT